MNQVKSLKGPLILLLCSFFWGMCFTAQSTAMHYIGPFTFLFMRSIITSVVLFVVARLLQKKKKETASAGAKAHVRYGALIGIFLFLASALQQIGIVTTTTAKSGFITALYIIIVPLLGIFAHKRPSVGVLVAALVSVLGLYFLCMRPEQLNLNIGDLYTFGCAILFSLHIITVDKFGGNLDSIWLSAIQFATVAVLSGICMFVLETPRIDGILSCWTSIVFAAVFSGCLGYTFQIIGQKYTDPTLASLIMCLEAVFSAVGGWIILNESLSGRELFGCALMLGASCIALLSGRKPKNMEA